MQKFSPITPNDVAPMSIDFAEFLADYADAITNATVTVSPASLTVAQVNHTNSVVNFVASNGAEGAYTLTFHIQTAGGAVWHRNAGLTVKAGL